MLRLVSYTVIVLSLLVHSSVVFCQQPTFFINARKTTISLQKGQKRLFKIKLQKDRLVQINTRKTQGNFIISLFSPNKEVLLKFDSRRSSLDPELFWIATSSGEYTLQIEALEKKSLLQVLIQIQNNPSSTQKQNAEANHLFSNAEQYSTQGDDTGLRQAVNLYSSARNLYQALGNRYMDALSEHNLALTYLQMGNLSESKAHFEASLQNFTLAKSPEGRAYCLVNLSSLYRSVGDPQKAMEVLEEALQLKQQLKNPYAKASIFENLAMIYMQTGELERALEVTRESLVLHTEIGNQQYISYDTNLLGLIYLYLGDQEKALEAFQKTLAFYKKTNNLAGQANSLANLAAVSIETESYQQALEYNTQALALLTYDTDNKLSALNNLGTIYAYLSDHKTSLECYLEALEVAQKITDSIGQGTIIGNIGSSYLELGEIDKA
ncbi:MAG: tetratricopeptide repeat protein, partial [Blastocatellia bacterium]|nr:tetratricopeptide repeat protein [Blastocatellia bacterium]